MSSTPPTDTSFSDWLSSLPTLSGIRALDSLPPRAATGSPRRASYHRPATPDLRLSELPEQQIFSLVREGTALRWRAGTAATAQAGRRAGSRAALPPGAVVQQYAFERLETSQVTSALVELDRRLTPNAAYGEKGSNGLRCLRKGRLVEFANPAEAAGKRALLLVHGTFSNSEALTTHGLATIAEGQKLLADVESRYDLVLAFDHPTLSVSPMLNAFDLAALLRPAPASLDVICHSRGGLVARWFCEGFAEPALVRRVLFVASPLVGTSLAAAPKLRSTIDLLTNVANVLRLGADLASANPLFLVASGLLRVVSAVTGVISKTPILDAAIALIPGLCGQSRIGNNEELRRLCNNTGTSILAATNTQYAAIQANFEPKEIGWSFLQLFSKPMQRIADFGADFIFDGQNDLVVDTASMTEVGGTQPIKVARDFGTTDRVHHTNYFRQPETVKAIRDTFGI